MTDSPGFRGPPAALIQITAGPPSGWQKTAMDSDLIQRYARPVPRYTSYPTAAQFTDAIGPDVLLRWLAAQPAGRRLGLYVHVPFCYRLCWYCACHTAAARSPAVMEVYASILLREARLVAAAVSPRAWAARQWGGGTPTQLGGKRFLKLSRALDALFPLAPGAEHSVELDPRAFSPALADALAAAGVTRASLGVQDFDPAVQAAINRYQDAACTAGAIDLLRARGIRRINLDLVYGLPRQTLDSLERTLSAALALRPDRFAVFGYAHVPWMSRRQKLIDESTLPGSALRHAMACLAAERLAAAGYRRVGLDHYARPDDPLAAAAERGELARSFQGYSDLPLEGTLGLGTSAITSLPEGHAQNEVQTAGYLAAIRAGRLATARGVARSEEDRLRGRIIERLLCDFAVDPAAEAGTPDRFAALRPSLARFAADGLILLEGSRITVTERGRPWVRTVAALFDSYHRPESGRHAPAV